MSGSDHPLTRKLDRLYPLTDEDRAVLEGACSKIVRVAEGEDIVREGDRPGECNLLMTGMVSRYRILEDGKRQIFSFHVPGDVYDAQSFLLKVMDHSIYAVAESTVGIIPHATMKRITEESHRIARAIWKDTLVDSAIFREWMVNLGRRSAYSRIAHLFCEIFVRLDAVGLSQGFRIAWPVTQAEIGDAVGLSHVHVNRSIQALRGDGLVSLKGAVLEILDWPALKKAGEFDAGYLHLGPMPKLGESGGT